MAKFDEILDTPDIIDEVTQLRLQTYSKMERGGRVALGLVIGLFALKLISGLLNPPSISFSFHYWYPVFDFLMSSGIYILMLILSFRYAKVAFVIGSACFLIIVVQSYLSYLPPNWYLMAMIQLLILTLFGVGIYGAFKKAAVLSN